MAEKKDATRKERRHTDEERESALALYVATGSIPQVAEQTGLPESTVRDWIKKSNQTDNPIAEIRAKRKQEFAEKCWKPITMGVELIERQMETCLDKQGELDKILDMVSDIEDKDIPYKEKQRIINNISKIARPDMRELTTAIGTLYDKQALAKGEKTQDIGISVESYLRKYEGDEF